MGHADCRLEHHRICLLLLLQVVGGERRIVQMQHEIKRKEKEYERLQER